LLQMPLVPVLTGAEKKQLRLLLNRKKSSQASVIVTEDPSRGFNKLLILDYLIIQHDFECQRLMLQHGYKKASAGNVRAFRLQEQEQKHDFIDVPNKFVEDNPLCCMNSGLVKRRHHQEESSSVNEEQKQQHQQQPFIFALAHRSILTRLATMKKNNKKVTNTAASSSTSSSSAAIQIQQQQQQQQQQQSEYQQKLNKVLNDSTIQAYLVEVKKQWHQADSKHMKKFYEKYLESHPL
jgi:hypothetical protein